MLLVQSASLNTPVTHLQTGWRVASAGRAVRCSCDGLETTMCV